MEKLVELLNMMADWVVYDLLGWHAGLWHANSFHYFISGFLQLMVLLVAVAFMMGAIGLSLPEALLLKKVMQVRLLVIYFGTTAVCMILTGYFFNVIF